jgi:hypothetical protein
LYLASRGRVEDAPSLEPDPGVAADPTSTVQRDARACRAAQGILADLRRADLFAPVEPLDIPPPIALATHLAELDGLLADGLITELWLRDAAPLLLAWGYERTGEPERALEAVRRHRVAMPGINFTSSYLREEGRLAARAGRADEARRAWARYLAMRAGAEPEVLSAVQEVRARFEALGPG